MLKRNELGQCKKLRKKKLNNVIVEVGLLGTLKVPCLQNMTGSTTLCFDEKKSCENKM